MAATIEMESYLPPQSVSGVCPDATGEVPPLSVESVDSMTKLTQLVGKFDGAGGTAAATSTTGTRAEGPTLAGPQGIQRRMLELSLIWTHSPQLPSATPSKSAGKLDTPGTGDQVPGGEQQQVHNPIVISPVVGGYRLPGQVNGVHHTLLLDTGAAVTLLRQDVLARVSTPPPELRPWTGATLVSAGGVPLEILGCSCLSLTMGGHTFQTEFVIVSPLTSDAILGIDFLQAQRALIDLDQGVLRLREGGCDMELYRPRDLVCQPDQQVRTVETVEIPPRSVMEVPAFCESDVQGVWLVEEARDKHYQVVVARALVQPTSGLVPVCVLNMRDEPVTLYAGSVVASLTSIEPPPEAASVGETVVAEASDEKKQMLRQLVEETGTEHSAGERETFYNLLLMYADTVASTTDLGRSATLKHKIETGSAPPIRQPVRRVSPRRREEVKRLLDQMLQHSVIQPSSSPWASPVVLVQKKDGSVRFCIDYRKLNEVTRKDAYPLPRIDMTLDALHGSQWFSTLDLLSGYWQMELEENAKEKTAFCTTEGLHALRALQCPCLLPAAHGSRPDRPTVEQVSGVPG